MESTCPLLSNKLVQSSEDDLEEGEVKGKGMGTDMLCYHRASYIVTQIYHTITGIFFIVPLLLSISKGAKKYHWDIKANCFDATQNTQLPEKAWSMLKDAISEFPGGLVVKDSALSLLWFEFDPWSMNFHMLRLICVT